ncbi:MAG: leucyl aminopeptidase family protein [Myxococcota bacterium]|jgi:probable aminopeptidase NPEPL1|nr:leucyl aminopeptidase family protein [Myxococcota bacterium]
MVFSRASMHDAPSLLDDTRHLVIVGRRELLLSPGLLSLLPTTLASLWPALLEQAPDGEDANQVHSHYAIERGDWAKASAEDAAPRLRRLSILLIPKRSSRHNSAVRADALSDALRGLESKGPGYNLLMLIEDPSQALPLLNATARACPRYSTKTAKTELGGTGQAPNRQELGGTGQVPNGQEVEKTLKLGFLLIAAQAGTEASETSERLDLAMLQRRFDAIRRAAELVDMPCSELDSASMVGEALSVATALGSKIQCIQGEELRLRGYGGIYAVGRCARTAPALVQVSHEPDGASKTVVLVGKGVVYDTGGLSLKNREQMGGMKGDMAAAAAVLHAYATAVQEGFPHRLHAILCLAENAIGTEAFRPDDILTMYSGKTVEINNTDAEGRLLLADGLAHAVKHLHPDVLIDLATLTGAQLVATGRHHAGLVSNDEALEQAALQAGRESGDLTAALLWCPELLKSEFRSKVADMKNSVKDRMNAQSSAAAVFLAQHLGDYARPWLHVDMAGPAWHAERGTGYGVALLLRLLESLSA